MFIAQINLEASEIRKIASSGMVIRHTLLQ